MCLSMASSCHISQALLMGSTEAALSTVNPHTSYPSDGTLSCMAFARGKHRSIDAHCDVYAPQSSAVLLSSVSVLAALLSSWGQSCTPAQPAEPLAPAPVNASCRTRMDSGGPQRCYVAGSAD